MKDDIYEHIADYLAQAQKGTVPETLEKKVKDWCNASEANQLEFNKLQKAWQLSSSRAYPNPDVEAAWQTVLGKLEQTETGKQIKLQKNTFVWVRYAAAITLLLSATAVWFLLQSDVWFKWTNTQITTAQNEKKNIELADGTQVMLNGGSVLYYAEEFSDESRKVLLEGEAYFNVAHKPQQPFIVTTGNTKTRVLGTQFNLRHYPEEVETEVFLKEGKVVFGTEKSSVTLRPGEVATYNLIAERLDKSENLNENITAWQTGRLQFTKALLSTVVNTLSRFYRKEILLPEPNKLDCTYTGTFDKITLQEALELMQFSADFTFKEENGKIIISGTLCP